MKKHKCNICDYAFSTKTILKCHMQDIHEEIKNIETDAEVCLHIFSLIGLFYTKWNTFKKLHTVQPIQAYLG